MNTEQKAKVYDEALKQLKECTPDENGFITIYPQEIFPELKEESGDEKIRKELLDYCKSRAEKYPNDPKYKNISTWIAWLEKQGEEKPIDPDTIIQQRLDALDDIVAEQKPDAKVEQKFKVGDWITNGIDVCKIKNIDLNEFNYISENGISDISLVDNISHLWTIQDAKDGDVLVEDSCIFIIQKLGDNSTAAKTYCTLYNDGDFDDGSILYFDIDSTKPATKEQRDTLFAKIKEAGYEWNAEKKELKKI